MRRQIKTQMTIEKLFSRFVVNLIDYIGGQIIFFHHTKRGLKVTPGTWLQVPSKKIRFLNSNVNKLNQIAWLDRRKNCLYKRFTVMDILLYEMKHFGIGA